MKTHKRFLSLCMTVILLLGMLAIPAAAAEPQIHWTGTFNHADNNTVVNVSLPSDPKRVEQAWSTKVGNNTIVIVDDAIYTYNGINPVLWSSYEDGGTFYKLDANTGEVLQSVSCDYGTMFYYSYSIYANDMIYVACPTAVMAFDPVTFTLKWQKEVPTKCYPTLQYIGGCIVTNGTVLNAENGEIIPLNNATDCNWGDGWSNGVEKNGKFYVADATESLFAIDTTRWTVETVWASDQEAATSCAGVMYYDGSLYWGGVSGKLHSITLDANGAKSETMETVNAGIKCYGAPAAYNGKVYLAGMTVNDSVTNTGRIAISVHDAKNLSNYYQTQNEISGKIQSTPILTADASGTVRVYVQCQEEPGSIYYLEDTASATSGNLVLLASPNREEYAWGQLACDQNGALYCANDAGYLMKYQAKKQLPQSPFYGGDVDGNGSIDMRDIILLCRYMANWNVTIQETEADTDGNGELTMGDVIQLRRYLAGWFS